MNLIYDLWTMTEYKQYMKYMSTFADAGYREFQISLMPRTKRILGVKMPVLRKLALEILKGNWRSFLELCTTAYYEEMVMKGLVTGMCHVPFMEYTHRIETFTLIINNWTICDTFCTGLKSISDYPIEFWVYLDSLLKSKNPWQIRVALVTMLHYYINDTYVNAILARADAVRHQHYYVKTAVAWLISTIYIRYPGVTYGYLTGSNLDKWTYRRTLDKILESREVAPEQKMMIEDLKKVKRKSLK